METLFENRCIRTKEIAKETYGWFYFKRPAIIFAHTLFAFDMVLLLLFGMFKGDWGFPAILGAVVAFVVIMRIWLYFVQVKTLRARDLEVSGGRMVEVTVSFTSEKIITDASTGSHSEMEYTQVKKVARTKNLIILRTKANLLHIIKKDAFTIGDCAAFEAFLKQKGFKI